MESTSKENMAKTNISEGFGVAELKTGRKVNVEGGIAAPPVKIAASVLKFPASLMDKDKALMFLVISILILLGLAVYNGILHIGLHLAVSNPDAMEAEICKFFLVLNSVLELVASILGLVYQILKVKWNRN